MYADEGVFFLCVQFKGPRQHNATYIHAGNNNNPVSRSPARTGVHTISILDICKNSLALQRVQLYDVHMHTYILYIIISSRDYYFYICSLPFAFRLSAGRRSNPFIAQSSD